MLTMSLEQASAVSGFSPDTIKAAYDRGELGKCVPEGILHGRIPMAELEKWIHKNTVIKSNSVKLIAHQK